MSARPAAPPRPRPPRRPRRSHSWLTSCRRSPTRTRRPRRPATRSSNSTNVLRSVRSPIWASPSRPPARRMIRSSPARPPAATLTVRSPGRGRDAPRQRPGPPRPKPCSPSWPGLTNRLRRHMFKPPPATPPAPPASPTASSRPAVPSGTPRDSSIWGFPTAGRCPGNCRISRCRRRTCCPSWPASGAGTHTRASGPGRAWPRPSWPRWHGVMSIPPWTPPGVTGGRWCCPTAF